MYRVSKEEFKKIVSDAIDGIPPRYANNINNLAFVIEDEPSKSQIQRGKIHPGHTLLGLYEGIPLTRRNSNYNLVLPDKISLFKRPIEQNSASLEQLISIVKKTVWHEVAHYYGLGHDRIHELEQPK